MVTLRQPTAEFPNFMTLRRFSTTDYLHMVEAGVLGPQDKVELFGGMVVEMSPAGLPHNRFLKRLIRIFSPVLDEFDFTIQSTLPVGEGHVFDPDFLLFKRADDAYEKTFPDPSEVLLVIEVSHSSLQRDQQVKLPIYAEAGIMEYWIADLEREELLVHRQPERKIYRDITTHLGNDLLSPLAIPGFSFAVHEAFT